MNCNADELGESVGPIEPGESVTCNSVDRIVASKDLADGSADEAAVSVLNDIIENPDGGLSTPASKVAVASIA